MTGLPLHRPPAWPVTVIVSLLLNACTTVGPDFKRPAVPWLDNWSGGSLEAASADAQPRERPQTEDWWRNFNDPVLDQLIAEAQRLNPNVRTAGMRIMEARAQLGIAGSALYPQVQQVTGDALRAGQNQVRRRRHRLLHLQHRAEHRLGTGLLGQVPARHRGGRCQLLRQHRAVRRCPGAGGGAGGQLLQQHPHHRTASAHRPRKCRAAETQPGDHRASVQERQRIRTGRAAGQGACT